MQNTKQILSNLYGLMMEINFHREDEEVLRELQECPDQQIDNHILRIKQVSAKLKAESKRSRFKKAKEQLALLKNRGVEEVQKLFTIEERAQFVPLFRKFEDLSEEDEKAIMEDQDLLKLLEMLDKRTDDES